MSDAGNLDARVPSIQSRIGWLEMQLQPRKNHLQAQHKCDEQM
jgi:hypothetical protein